MENIMIDLETMGVRPNAAIVAIGAVAFDERGCDANTFYRVIKLESSLANGAVMDGNTVMWWLQQSEQARAALRDNAVEIRPVLIDFGQWFKSVGGMYAWGNGSDFDNVVLRSAYVACTFETPWKYNHNRCYRTLKSLYPHIQPLVNNDAHNALSDAAWQAEHASRILKEIK